MPGSYNNASQAPYGSPGVQASVPGSVVSTASVASPTGAVVSTPEDMVSFLYNDFNRMDWDLRMSVDCWLPG